MCVSCTMFELQTRTDVGTPNDTTYQPLSGASVYAGFMLLVRLERRYSSLSDPCIDESRTTDLHSLALPSPPISYPALTRLPLANSGWITRARAESCVAVTNIAKQKNSKPKNSKRDNPREPSRDRAAIRFYPRCKRCARASYCDFPGVQFPWRLYVFK